jgi:hypothetical protein
LSRWRALASYFGQYPDLWCGINLHAEAISEFVLASPRSCDADGPPVFLTWVILMLLVVNGIIAISRW